MSGRSKYLKSRDLRKIESWMNRVERHQYRPRKSLVKKARKKLKLRYKVEGNGKKRIVYKIKKGLVLKVAIAKSGINDTMREVKLYKAASSKLKKHLAKIKDHGYGWVVMKRYNKRAPHTQKIKRKVKLVAKRFKRRGIRPRDLLSSKNTVRWGNIRLGAKRRIVVIDYGNFKFM